MSTVDGAGSLCSGFDGLALAHGVPLAWHAENDRHAATIHDTHWPGLPNLGDITKVDWTDVAPVDLLTAGFPCQPISEAGKRKVKQDDRWIWPHIARAVRVLRPRWVWLENVPPLLRPWRDDDGWWNPAPVEEVVGDLAEAGYDTQWCSVRAFDVGACHRRERVFILAGDSERVGEVAQRGTTDGATVEPDGAGRQVVADADDERRDGCAVSDGPEARGFGVRSGDEPGRCGRNDWWRATPERAEYAPAVERWERRLFRPAPPLHDDRGRLNPRFTEWMMGLPDGWVTGCDVPVTAQHKAIGNGVQVQAAAMAWHHLTGYAVTVHATPAVLLPTPSVSDAKGGSPCHAGTMADLSLSLSSRHRGSATATARASTGTGDWT